MTRFPITGLTILSCVTFTLLQAGDETSRTKEALIAAVRDHLKGKYTDETKPKFAWYNENAKLTVVDSPPLRKYLPQYRFYATTFWGRSLNYLNVETMVAASMTDGRVLTRECHSPIYCPESEGFLLLFRGLKAKKGDEQKVLGQAIAELFQQITYRGDLRHHRYEGTRYSVDLCTDGRRYRTVVVKYDADGKLTSVDLILPEKRND